MKSRVQKIDTDAAASAVAPENTGLLEVARANGKAVHTGLNRLVTQRGLMLRFMGAA